MKKGGGQFGYGGSKKAVLRKKVGEMRREHVQSEKLSGNLKESESEGEGTNLLPVIAIAGEISERRRKRGNGSVEKKAKFEMFEGSREGLG